MVDLAPEPVTVDTVERVRLDIDDAASSTEVGVGGRGGSLDMAEARKPEYSNN